MAAVVAGTLLIFLLGGAALRVLPAQANGAFVLLGYAPPANTISAPVTTSIVLTYSAAVDVATVTSHTVAVHSMQRGLMAVQHSVTGNIVTITPPQPFFPGELVYTSATRQTEDITGTQLAAAGVWQFETAVAGGGGELADTVDFGVPTHPTYGVAWGDFDGDGDLDLAVANYNGAQNAVYRNAGDGSFAGAVNFGAVSDDASGLAWGDFDGDGDLDLAVGNYGQQNQVHLNDGAGGFASPGAFGPGNDRTYSIAAGDFDGDGDLDLAAGNFRQQNWVYLDDGSGGFGGGLAFGTGSDDTTSVAWGDCDGDGDLDLAAGNAGPNLVYLNNANGGFLGFVPFGTGNDQTNAVAWDDFDRDGDLDIAVVNTRQQNAVYLNDGSCSFPPGAANIVPFGSSADTSKAAWGDVDGDGYPDLAVGDFWNGLSYLYRNNGSGGFDDPVSFGDSLDRTYGLAWDDFDGDGDLDLAAGNWGRQSNVYRNVPATAPRYLPIIVR